MATSTFALAPNPHWVIIDNFSKLPNGAVIYTYSQLNPNTYQPAYMDAGGTLPYPQPIPGCGNGTMPPIFWSTTLPYYIQVWNGLKGTTVNGTDAVMLWDFQGLLGGSGGGGGGGTVTNNDVENLVINGTFFRPLGSIGNPGTPLATNTLMILAPSNNAGYVNNPLNANGYTGPDIAFSTTNTSAMDAISFNQFIPSGVNVLNTDVTPPYYVNYNCTVAGSAETYKFFQFPISNGIVNLGGQTITVRLWANLISGSPNVNLVIRQFYGDGNNSPSADITTQMGGGFLPLTAGSGWNLYQFTTTLPAALGTIGNCGNDATFLQIQMPGSLTTNFSFIKPGVYLGTDITTVDYHTNDMIDSIVNSPRTGDVRISLNSFLLGWIAMNDGTIGNAASNATSRANIDTFPLFDLIWRTFQGSQTLAPMFTSGSSPVAYGVTSFADFNANNQLMLTVQAGRVIAGVSGSHLIGTSGGADTHTNTIGEMANHFHTVAISGVVQNYAASGAASTYNTTGPSTTTFNTSAVGGGAAWDVRQPTVYQNILIKL